MGLAESDFNILQTHPSWSEIPSRDVLMGCSSAPFASLEICVPLVGASVAGAGTARVARIGTVMPAILGSKPSLVA